MGQHHHGQGRHEQGHDHGHRHGGHDHTDIDWAELAEHLEGQAELFAPLNRRAAAWVAAHAANRVWSSTSAAARGS